MVEASGTNMNFNFKVEVEQRRQDGNTVPSSQRLQVSSDNNLFLKSFNLWCSVLKVQSWPAPLSYYGSLIAAFQCCHRSRAW